MSDSNAAPIDPSTEPSGVRDRNFLHLALIIVVGIFAVTLPQTAVLGGLSIKHILKDKLHLAPDQMSAFLLLVGIAWYLKPICGVLTDAFPIFGTRRRHYILVSSVAAALAWVAVGILPTTYGVLLAGLIVVNAFMVMTSTVVGGFLVEAGQQMGATGRLTSIRQAMFTGCSLINGVASGFLATKSFLITACVNGVLVFSIFPVAYKYLREKRTHASGPEKLKAAGGQLKTIFSSRAMWTVILLLGLYYFAPGFGTLVYYRQNDILHLNQQYIGTLGSIGGAGGVISSLLYGLFIRKFNVRTMILVGIGINALGTLWYLHYTSASWAAFVEFQQGFTGGLAEVALLDLAARTIPKGCEGMGYALLLSIRNLAGNGGDYMGTLLHKGGWTFESLVMVNAATTAAALIFLPLIPKALLLVRDRDMAEQSAA